MSARYSLVGRPRKVTDTAITQILTWHRTRLSKVQLARQLRISTTTITNVIRTAGQHYKQPSPEKRTDALANAHRRRAFLERAHLIA